MNFGRLFSYAKTDLSNKARKLGSLGRQSFLLHFSSFSTGLVGVKHYDLNETGLRLHSDEVSSNALV